jgi:hypothetical protein
VQAILDDGDAQLQLDGKLVRDRGELEVVVRRRPGRFVLGTTSVGELQHRRRRLRLRPGLLAGEQTDPIEQLVGPPSHASNLRRSEAEIAP